MDCCFSEIALEQSKTALWSSTKQTLSSHYPNVTFLYCPHSDVAETLLSWRSISISYYDTEPKVDI